MPTFAFGLSATSIDQIHDGLACLAKFDEDVVLEPSGDKLRLFALNVSKTAFASLTFQASNFFETYHFAPSQPVGQAVRGTSTPSWACRLQNRALLSVFRRRPTENREVENSVQRCEFELLTGSEDRLVIKLYCWPNVIKTFRFTYEAANALIPELDETTLSNTWTLSSRTLRDVVSYFGPKTEHVDWSKNDNEIIFTSYTEKIQVGREIVRQPAHTSVKLNKEDFEQCVIEGGIHVSISVKDFRSIVAHAEIMGVPVKVAYSEGRKGARVQYGSAGLTAQYTLSTKGTSSSVASASKASTPARVTTHIATSSSHATNAAAPQVHQNLRQMLLTNQLRETDAQEARSQQSTEDAQAEEGIDLGVRQVSQAKPSPRKARTLMGNPLAAKPASSRDDDNSMFFRDPEEEDNAWNPQEDDAEPQSIVWDNAAARNVFESLPSRFKAIRASANAKGSSLRKRKANFGPMAATQRDYSGDAVHEFL